MNDDTLDIAGSCEDAEASSVSVSSESIPEETLEEIKTEDENVLENEGSEEYEGSGEIEGSVVADSESSPEESESNAIADSPFRAASADGYISYVSVPSGYEVVSVSNIPDYTNFFIVLIFALGSLLGFGFARIASWR